MRARLPAVLLLSAVLTEAVAAAAPSATDFTLKDVDGHTVTLSDFRGKVVVLAFWATWCGPCRAELPQLQKLHARHRGDDVVVIGVSTDDERTAGKVGAMASSQGWTFPMLLDRDQSVTRIYDPSRTVPTTVVIGRDFQVAEAHTGYAPGDERHLEDVVSRLLQPR